MNIWPFRRHSDGRKNQNPPLVKELRIATSGSYSIKAAVESLRVDGAGSYSQGGRVRAALFSPLSLTTIQFHADNHKKPGVSARASCVHVVQMFTPSETTAILDDAKRIGTVIGWCAAPLWGVLCGGRRSKGGYERAPGRLFDAATMSRRSQERSGSLLADPRRPGSKSFQGVAGER
jgi:hypothetical protein